MSVFPSAGTQPYSLLWKKCSPGSDASLRFAMPDFDGWLPFLIWGVDLESLHSSPGVELREEHLLKGILYGLYELDHDPKPWTRKTSRPALAAKLGQLAHGYGYGRNLEKMILDAGFSVREINGIAPTRLIYETGLTICPYSSMIRSDLICTLWDLFMDNNSASHLLNQIVTLVAEVDSEAINPNAKEIIYYYGLCALVLLGKRDQCNSYLERYVYPHIANANLKKRIASYLKVPCRHGPADMTLL